MLGGGIAIFTLNLFLAIAIVIVFLIITVFYLKKKSLKIIFGKNESIYKKFIKQIIFIVAVLLTIISESLLLGSWNHLSRSRLFDVRLFGLHIDNFYGPSLLLVTFIVPLIVMGLMTNITNQKNEASKYSGFFFGIILLFFYIFLEISIYFRLICILDYCGS